MDKYLIVLVLATAVLGQRYRPPQQADERSYYDYGDEDDDSEGGNDQQPYSSPDSIRQQQQPLPPKQIINNYYATDCKSKERTLAHEKYCDHYYQLNGCSGSDDQAILRACPNGLVYTGNGRHGLIGVCDYPHRAECSGGRERHNPPISTEHCDWLYGIFGHETSCTRYWTCWNGTATEQFCIGGLLYNEETHACDWPQNVGGCQKHPLCKDDPNGNVPLGKSCNRYWACQGGYPRLQRCPAMLVFDKERKRCVSPPTADCDVPSTTPQPDSEDEGGDLSDDLTSGPRRPDPRNNPENRRRFQQQQQQSFQDGGLPFDIPSGAVRPVPPQ